MTTTVRTQAERSRSTRATLIEAAIELLVERGWAATTAVAVCDRAGVSRGALLHHYDGVADLLSDALATLYDELVTGEGPPTSMVELVDRTWSVIGSPRFPAVIEAWLAAGNDPELGRSIGPVIANFAKLVHPDQASTGPLGGQAAAARILVIREAMIGLALGRATTGGAGVDHERIVIDELRADAAAFDARTLHRKDPT